MKEGLSVEAWAETRRSGRSNLTGVLLCYRRDKGTVSLVSHFTERQQETLDMWQLQLQFLR